MYDYVVPNCGGDSYYNFKFTPFDEDYLPIEGHFYVYRSTDFGSLNLSDNGKIAFVIPAEILQVAYAEDLRLFLANHLSKITLITFE